MAYAAYKLTFMEYERGWGSKPFDSILFLKKENAVTYANAYNKHYNTAMSAPDWYIQPTDPYLIEIDEEKFTELTRKGDPTFSPN